jgi:HD-like signal output (HDOD) protein
MNQKMSFLEIIDEILSSEKTLLPVFNRIALKIQQEVAKEEPDLHKIEKLIANDPSLTGQVLRTANSAFYKGMVKLSTVKNAVIRLGAREISNIVVLSTQSGQYKAKHPVLNQMMSTLWRHAVGCALGSQWLAKKCGYADREHEAFTAGLLHDVGKLLLLTVMDSVQARLKTPVQEIEILIGEIMDSFHTEHGYTLLKKWNIPEFYAVIARDHHKEDYDTADSLLLMVRLANQACNKLGISLHPDPELILGAEGESSLLSLSEIDLAQLEIKLEDSPVFSAP